VNQRLAIAITLLALIGGALALLAVSRTKQSASTGTATREETGVAGGSPGPPAVSATVPGTGGVIAEDRATAANPSNVWGGQDSPASWGYEADGADDPYFERRSGDGDPHVAIERKQPTADYRRYFSEAGVQSIWDQENGRITTRTQSQRFGPVSGNEMAFAPGDYVFYLSFRLQSPSPFPYTIEEGGVSGNANHSQLFQFKSFGGGQGQTFSPPLSGLIASDGIGIKYRNPVDDSKLIRSFHVPVGEWVRMAIVANWDSDGWYEVWADRDGSGRMVEVVPRQSGLDFLGGRAHSAWGIGLYHQMGLFDGTVPGQPRQAIVYTDYANAQITRYTGG
jgi:hypothetical protein